MKLPALEPMEIRHTVQEGPSLAALGVRTCLLCLTLARGLWVRLWSHMYHWAKHWP